MPQVTQLLLGGAHVASAAWCVYHALMYKQDSRSALGWIMVALFVPFAGPIAYFLFGINRIRSRAYGLRRPYRSADLDEDTVRVALGVPGVPTQLITAGGRISGNAAIGGNSLAMLHCGDEAYPAMLDAIAGAKRRLFLSTYIMNHDDVGIAFADALGEAVRRGVDVRVLLDGVGEYYGFPWMSGRLVDRDVRVARFLPPRLLPPSFYINLRNHRKILVADDDLAFLGGINISEDNVTSEHRQRSVADIHFRLRGPAASRLASVFAVDWAFATGGTIEEVGDACPPDGGAACRVIADGPDNDYDALAMTIESAIGCAVHSVDVMTPYFLPDGSMLAMLTAAALRGVRVRIVLPRKNNLPFVHWAAQNRLLELARWSVEIYYQPPPFCHAKLLRIDDAYSLIGSANLDARSLKLNFEIGMEVFDSALATELGGHFDRTIDGSDRVTAESLLARSTAVRLRDSAAALLSPYL